jgi:hypothetical protein
MQIIEMVQRRKNGEWLKNNSVTIDWRYRENYPVCSQGNEMWSVISER